MLNTSIWKSLRTVSSGLKHLTQPIKFNQLSKHNLRYFSSTPGEFHRNEKNLKFKMLNKLDFNEKERELYTLHHSFPKNEQIYYRLINFLNKQQKFDTVVTLSRNSSHLYSENAKIIEEHEIAHRFAEVSDHNSQNRKTRFNMRLRSLINCALIYMILKYIFNADLEISITNDDEESENTNQKEIPSNDSSDSASDQGGFTNFILKNYTQTVTPETNVNTKFNEVLGIDEFKDELLDIVDFLKNPRKYELAGAKIPKGVLLSGPPGTGKTQMARALAGEAKCSFFYKSASEFDEVFVGMGALRIRKLFEAARKHAPSIIFIDELDSIAGRRHPFEPPEKRETLNQILSEMDGFKQNEKIILVGATNLGDSLDPAILRAGRFDKTIHVPYPDQKGRTDIQNYYLSKIKSKNIDPQKQSKRLIGFTGADIKNFVNLAILRAVKQDKTVAGPEEFDFAYDRILMGIRRPKLLAEEDDRRAIAYHEVGHALTALLTPGADKLYKVTILPSGQSLGHTSLVPENSDAMFLTNVQIKASIDVGLGGRAAEELFQGQDNISVGCSSDLDKTTYFGYKYIRDYCLDDDSFFQAANKDQLSDEYNFKVDTKVNELMIESYERVKGQLLKNETAVKSIVESLLEKETLSMEEVKSIINLK